MRNAIRPSYLLITILFEQIKDTCLNFVVLCPKADWLKFNKRFNFNPSNRLLELSIFENNQLLIHYKMRV